MPIFKNALFYKSVNTVYNQKQKVTLSITSKAKNKNNNPSVKYKGQHSLHTHICTYQPVNPSVPVCASMTADAAPLHSLRSFPLKSTEDTYQ